MIVMSEYKARVLLNPSQDVQRQATVRFIGSIGGASTPATDRPLLESAATQARSLEGRPLAMYSSLMLPDRPGLRLLESGPRFAAVSAERGDRCPPSEGQGIAGREAEADARALGEEGRVLDFGMFVPWVLATKRLVGRVQQAVARRVKSSPAFCFLAFEKSDPRIAPSTRDI
jgi:hypothetical protein